jgi:HSP20 family protein
LQQAETRTVFSSSNPTKKPTIIAPTTAALVAAITHPALVEAWSLGPSYFASPLVISSPSSILRRQQALMDRAFQQRPSSSPRYEITDNEDKFQLAVDVPGVKMEDINVSVDDHVLTVSGHRESVDASYRFTSRFSQSFSLDPAVDMDKFSASLENGVLVVTAPKDMKKIESNVRQIPIAAAHPKIVEEKKSIEASSETMEANVAEDVAKDINIESKDTHAV